MSLVASGLARRFELALVEEDTVPYLDIIGTRLAA